jgi:hypothetical protein
MKSKRKIISILIVASMSVALFAGCSSKTADTSSATNQTTTNGRPGNGNNRSFDPAAMKTRYESVLKDLVTAGTITQDQSDKVLEAVTKNIPNPGSKGSNQSSDKNSQSQNNQAGNGQNRTRNNPLSALVTSGVITQAQADAINQKLRGNMKNPQNNHSNQSTQ